jgi:hypothetical protein
VEDKFKSYGIVANHMSAVSENFKQAQGYQKDALKKLADIQQSCISEFGQIEQAALHIIKNAVLLAAQCVRIQNALYKNDNSLLGEIARADDLELEEAEELQRDPRENEAEED